MFTKECINSSRKMCFFNISVVVRSSKKKQQNKKGGKCANKNPSKRELVRMFCGFFVLFSSKSVRTFSSRVLELTSKYLQGGKKNVIFFHVKTEVWGVLFAEAAFKKSGKCHHFLGGIRDWKFPSFF